MSPIGFLKREKTRSEINERVERGFLVFENTSEVIKAENILKHEGWEIR